MDWMYAFSAFDQIPELLTQPMLLVAGSKADTKIFSDQAHELSNGPKELFVVEGATHIALYDVPEYVDQAINKITDGQWARLDAADAIIFGSATYMGTASAPHPPHHAHQE